MSIASAIVNKQQQVASCYTAISNKGGTLPATQDVANMPTAINSIPTGGGGGSKYGCTIDDFLGDVDANGVYQSAAGSGINVVFTGVKKIGTFQYTGDAMAYLFYRSDINSISFPDLENIAVTNALNNICYGANLIQSASFPKLKVISGNSAFSNAFYYSSVGDISFDSLEEITGISAFSYCFNAPTAEGLRRMEKVYFPKLFNIPARGIFGGCFNTQSKLTDIYFNALTTTSFGSNIDQFSNMFNSNTGSTATGGCTVHFPSNLSTVVAGLTGYPTFGGSSSYITIAFDLQATS